MNRLKHIVLYTDDPEIGGVAQYNHSILCGLVQAGCQVTCVQSQRSNPLIDKQKQLGVQHLWLQLDTVKYFSRTFTDASDAQRILPSIQPDLIIFSNCGPVSNFAAKQVAVKLGIPYIIVEGFVAAILIERFPTYVRELPHFYAQACEVIAVSNENLNLLHESFGLPKDKGQVVYYGRAAEYFIPPNSSTRQRLRQELGIPFDATVCFTAARLQAVKGYQYQFEAIKQLKQSSAWPQLYFVWAGPGSLETQLKHAVNQLGVSNQVKILGQRWDVPDLLDTADIFILPSELEGMPLSIMEAMAKGLPVIASAVSGIPEELGDTGKLLTDPKVDPQATIKELVTTIQAWSVNPELRQSIGQACKRRAEEKFTEQRMVQETIQVIERVLVSNKIVLEEQIAVPAHNSPNIYDFTGITKWNKLQDCFTLEKAIAVQNLIKQLPERSEVVELGVFQGRSSVAMAAVLPAKSMLYCIDDFKGSTAHRRANLDLSCLFEVFIKNLEEFGVKDRVRVLPMLPQQAAEKFEPQSVDLIFLNIDCDYDSVKAHLLQWYPKLKLGGFLLCDDYEPAHPGVMRAIKSVGLEGQLIAPSLWCHRNLM